MDKQMKELIPLLPRHERILLTGIDHAVRWLGVAFALAMGACTLVGAFTIGGMLLGSDSWGQAMFELGRLSGCSQ